MKQQLLSTLAAAIAECSDRDPAEITGLLEKPKRRDHGDLAFPCFVLAKDWKCAPQDCAKRLKEALTLPPGFSKCLSAGAFLNFSFDRHIFSKTVVEEILTPCNSPAVGKNVVVEYSSPNIAKPFHVGHLRATLIGNSLDRVYRSIGWNTVSVNHLGDWGTQFGFVWAGCKLWGKPKTPTVASLVELYRRATELKEKQAAEAENTSDDSYLDVNELARGFFIDLENGEAYALDFWKECVDVSLTYLRATYERLNVTFDHYTGESFYSDKLEAVKLDLEKAGLLKESEGALGIDLGESLGFARISTPDGRSLYLTRDIATAKYRAETFKFDRAVYVVGAPQTLHFQQLTAILKALGHDYADHLIHVAFGHVLGMKTRGGGSFIELNEFLDEAYERALEAYHTQVSKRPEGLDETEVARGVALAAIIFSNLSRSNIKDVHFSWEHALEFQGDSGPYLLYAYARINGIKEKAETAGIRLPAEVDASLLSEDSAYELISMLAEYSETLERTAAENEPSVLTNYALGLAKTLSKAYLDLKVVGEEQESIASARLALFEATRITLRRCIELMGIRPLERM